MSVLTQADQAPAVDHRPAPDPGRRERRLVVAAWVLELLAALMLWADSLTRIRFDALGDYGLLPELGLGWYAATAWLVIGAVWLLAAGRPRPVLAAAYIGALVLVLYGTVAAVADVPHYPWTYKHIGVTRFIQETGSVDPSIDIYHRWPGFFTLTAFFSSLAGRANPIAYAAWAEPFFALVSTALVGAAARVLTSSTRAAGLAALFFALGNWVGQLYYAPQALALTLSLAVFVIVAGPLAAVRPPASGRIAALLARLGTQAGPAAAPQPRAPWPVARAVVAVVLLHAAVVVTHQLTPYIVLVAVGLLTVLGRIGPRRVLIVMAAITLAYLATNLGFVRDEVGLFTSFDPFNNASSSTQYESEPVAGKLLNSRATQALTLLVWLLAAAATVVLVRRRGAAALPLACLAAAPFAVLLGQNYGGEAVYRVFLFSLPWCACLIAWALVTVRRPRLRVAATAAVAAVLAALFVPAFFGQEASFKVTRAEVQASERLYAMGRERSVVMLSGPYFPARFHPRYGRMLAPTGAAEPDLLADDYLRLRLGRPGGVAEVVERMRSLAPHGYLVFTDNQSTLTRILGLAPAGTLERFEAAVRSSGAFRPWYRNEDVRIYELPPQPTADAGGPDASPPKAPDGPEALWEQFPLDAPSGAGGSGTTSPGTQP